MRVPSVAAACLLLTAGCHHPHRVHDGGVALPDAPASRPVLRGGICEVDPSACPNGVGSQLAARPGVQAEVYAVRQIYRPGSWVSSLLGTTAGASSSAARPQLPSSSSPSAAVEMIEVEARLAIQVEDLAQAAERFRAMVRAGGGTLTFDTATLGRGTSEATFEVRVPMALVEKTLATVEALGSSGHGRSRRPTCRRSTTTRSCS